MLQRSPTTKSSTFRSPPWSLISPRLLLVRRPQVRELVQQIAVRPNSISVENSLHWPSTPICLDPAFPSFVHCASSNSDPIVPQGRVGQFKDDAANIFVCEENVPREMHVIEIAVYVEKEGIAAPTEEETPVAGSRHQSFLPD